MSSSVEREGKGKGNLLLSEVKRKTVTAIRRVERSKTTTFCTDIAIEEGSLETVVVRDRVFREEGDELKKVRSFTLRFRFWRAKIYIFFLFRQ